VAYGNVREGRGEREREMKRKRELNHSMIQSIG
jgi:hypothetical protein